MYLHGKVYTKLASRIQINYFPSCLDLQVEYFKNSILHVPYAIIFCFDYIRTNLIDPDFLPEANNRDLTI